MVAKIGTPHRVSTALNYNEQKVTQGKAECLFAHGYLCEPSEMNFYQKLEVLESRSALNTRAATKTIHVSLNFDPSERLSKSTLVSIAERYMEGIGFGGQPYLVYEHRDAGHPHLHIVASAIREDGSRISLHNLGKGASEETRKNLEKEFHLVPAQGRDKKQTATKKNADTIARAIYGLSETRSTIQNIVTAVRREYAFGSIAQFNACLRIFGVVADAGKEGSRLKRYGGLLYRIITSEGALVGVPIKASRLSGSPTLKQLEKDFDRHLPRKKEMLGAVKEKIDRVLHSDIQSLENFKHALHAQNVQAIFHQTTDGRLYGITYVDANLKVVLNGSEMGKAQSASGVIAKIESTIPQTGFQKISENTSVNSHPQPSPSMLRKEQTAQSTFEWQGLHQVVTPESIGDVTTGSLLQKKRKRKKQMPNQNL